MLGVADGELVVGLEEGFLVGNPEGEVVGTLDGSIVDGGVDGLPVGVSVGARDSEG